MSAVYALHTYIASLQIVQANENLEKARTAPGISNPFKRLAMRTLSCPEGDCIVCSRYNVAPEVYSPAAVNDNAAAVRHQRVPPDVHPNHCRHNTKQISYTHIECLTEGASVELCLILHFAGDLWV